MAPASITMCRGVPSAHVCDIVQGWLRYTRTYAGEAGEPHRPCAKRKSKKGAWSMKRALVVVDVQNEYFSGVLPITYPQGHFTNILQVMTDCSIEI